MVLNYWSLDIKGVLFYVFLIVKLNFIFLLLYLRVIYEFKFKICKYLMYIYEVIILKVLEGWQWFWIVKVVIDNGELEQYFLVLSFCIVFMICSKLFNFVCVYNMGVGLVCF